MFNEESIYNFRNYYVAFSNEFATRSSYSYSLYAHRLFLYVLAKIPSYDGKSSNRQEKIEIDFNHFIAVFGLPTSGASYKKLHEALEILQKTPVFGGQPFIGSAEMIKKTIYNVSISKALDKHFYNLRSYVQFPLTSVIGFSSVYSFQFYATLLARFNLAEYIKKRGGNSVLEFSETFKMYPESVTEMFRLDQPSYKLYKNLNAAVIKKALNEINLYTDINVLHNGDNNEIMLTIRRKSSDEQLVSYSNLIKKLQKET